jgi:hypothetical protein
MRFVAPIASHNLLDVLSLAALLGRVATLIEGATPAAPHEALGLGRLLADRDPARALRAYEHAITGCGGPAAHTVRAEVLWRQALLLKRHGVLDEAVHSWRLLASGHGPWSLRAHEELAKFLEHRARDFAAAAAVVEEALARLEAGPVHAAGEDRRIAAFRQRLDRLRSRIASASRQV